MGLLPQRKYCSVDLTLPNFDLNTVGMMVGFDLHQGDQNLALLPNEPNFSSKKENKGSHKLQVRVTKRKQLKEKKTKDKWRERKKKPG